MTKDELIALAKEAHEAMLGKGIAGWLWHPDCTVGEIQEFIERFATLVAAKEREACALVCESIDDQWAPVGYKLGTIDCADAIRARKP